MGLSDVQREVMEAMFAGQDERAVLREKQISRDEFLGWLRSPEWVEEYNYRLDALRRRADLILATHKPAAAEKLVSLCGCEKEQTARLAAGDLLVAEVDRLQAAEANGAKMKFSPEAARQVRAILADDMRQQARKRRLQAGNRYLAAETLTDVDEEQRLAAESQATLDAEACLIG
jgi:hypothetical protein